MAEPFLGEIKLFSFDFAPKGWAYCNGQLMSIAQNQALFSLLGTTYGGNGQTTFALPDLRGRVPVHVGNNINLGESAGEETHTLTVTEMPVHTHNVNASNEAADQSTASGNIWAKPGANIYTTNKDGIMRSDSIRTFDGNQAHSNMQPYAVTNYCIAIQGIYPSRN